MTRTIQSLAIICFFLFSILLFFLHSFSLAQSAKIQAYRAEVKPYFCTNRIIIKLSSSALELTFIKKNGIMTTGIRSLDELNARFKANEMSRLFPGAEQNSEAVQLGLDRMYRIEFSSQPDIMNAVATYAANPYIEIAQPIGIHRVYGITPNDPDYSKQWALSKIRAPEAWAVNQGDSAVILAIVDTGVDWRHPDLGGATPDARGNIWTNWPEYHGTAGVDDDNNGYIDDIRGWDWVNVPAGDYPPFPGEDGTQPDNDPMDFNGHGTHCAGIASAITQNGLGIAGLGWNCKIMPLRAGWSAQYSGYEIGLVDMSFCAEAIYYAAMNGAVAVNCSWGSSNSGGLASAVDFAIAKGVMIISAAGNDDFPEASYLCSRADVISVAATEPNDIKASYSSYGYWVDVAAPGGDIPPSTNLIYSTYYDHTTSSHTYEWLRGTSMAAPHVVGLTGLISSQFPGLSWHDKKDRLLFTSDNLDQLNPSHPSGLLGEGRINAQAALTQIDIPRLTTFFEENFDNGLPADWSADPDWRDDDPGNRNADFDDYFEPGTIRVGYGVWTPPFLIVDSDYAGLAAIDASLVSPIIDCSMYSNIRLVFNNWFQNYAGDHREQGDIDIRVNQGPWQTVASFKDNGSYNIVDAARDIVIRLPASVDYQSSVQFRWHYYNANFDWFWGIDNIKLMGEMIHQNYCVIVTPTTATKRGEAGDTIAYPLKIKNIGLLNDSYDLTAIENHWSTSFWDSTGNDPIAHTNPLSSRQEQRIIVKVTLPIDAKPGEGDQVRVVVRSTSDSTVFATATLTSTVTILGRIPWFEDFPTVTIDSLRWCVNFGPATISSAGVNEPSPPYSLNLNGSATGGDEIQTCDIDLSSESNVILSYYYQRTGSGNSPEAGEDLFVDYLSASGSWRNLKQHLGDGIDMNQFVQEMIKLPDDAYHNNFRVRFRNIATAGNYDDWFVDDIYLGRGPDISVTTDPDPFRFSLELGDSTTGAVIIGNTGEAPLVYKISIREPGDTLAGQQLIPIPAPLTTVSGEAVKAAHPHRSNQPMVHDIAGETLISTPVDILIIYADDGANALRSILLGYPDIRKVDTWSADPGGSIPDLTVVHQYHLVIAWNNYPWADKYAIGNVLADFIDAGGKVITLVDCWSASPFDSHGRYFDEGYSPFVSLSGAQFNPRTLGWFNPYHPIMQGISQLSITDFYNNVALTSAAELVAAWDDSTPLIATKPNTVAINIWPGDGYYWAGDFPTLIHNSIRYLIAGAERHWLSFTPTSGSIPPQSSDSVRAHVSAEDLIPDSTYSANVLIQSNDPYENLVTFPASLYVKATNFYFTISPPEQAGRGKAGDTLNYYLSLKNFGRLTDSYDLAVMRNHWSTTVWDSTGKLIITNTGPIGSKAELKLVVKVTIPATATYGKSDTAAIQFRSTGQPSLMRTCQIRSMSIGTPAHHPWSDQFTSATLNPTKWIMNSGPAVVNNMALNEPSPPYSLNLDGYSTSGDEVRSEFIDLSQDSLVVLSYYWQRGGNGDPPDVTSDLQIQFLDEADRWKTLKQHSGNGTRDSIFSFEEIILPKEAYHHAFQLKLKSRGLNNMVNNDDWFIDDISISLPAKQQVQPTGYDAIMIAGDSLSATPPLQIYNQGVAPLRYQLFAVPAIRTDVHLTFAPATRDYPASYYSMELQKDQIDPRVGAPIVQKMGGPDKFGYYWIDSDEPGAPPFNWIDISTKGTEITGLSGDTNVGFFPIGFDFPFYGRSYFMFRFCTNGFISFTSFSTDWSNDPIPNQDVYDLVAPFWDDLYCDTNSKAYYHYDGKRLIVQYNNFRIGSSQYNTFEILLYPDGSIVFQYLLMQSSSASATVGIQNYNGSDGLEIAFNSAYIHDRMAISISTGLPWLKLSRKSGIITAGKSDTISLKFLATNFASDTTLFADVVIKSNDPWQPISRIPAKLKVIAAEFISGIIGTDTRPLNKAIAEVWDEYPLGTIIDNDTTDAEGRYVLTVPPLGKTYTVRAHCQGYFPAFQERVRGNTANLAFNLRPMPNLIPTTAWVDFFSKNSKFWGGPIQIGDVITAEDPNGVICGSYQVDKAPGHYGFMPVYGDDPYSISIDEGAAPGDTITFRINGYLAIPMGPDSPIWTAHGHIQNIDLTVEEIDTVKIQLSAGWNLISWYVKPSNDSTHVLLKDILTNTLVVLGFEQGALVYDPKNPDLSNLHKMDHLHGYWVKMIKPDTLQIIGNPANHAETPIYCERGWNLVSFLPQQPDSIVHGLHSVLEHLVRSYGFHHGAKTYDPNHPEFSTLHVLCPGSGYWLYLTEDDTLIYPKPIPAISCPDAQQPAIPLHASALSNENGPIPTYEWINVFGDGIKLNGSLLAVGTKIIARDAHGTVCGEFVVTTPGRFGFMPIYRDDPGTLNDDGATPGEPITIWIDDLRLPTQIVWTHFGDIIDLTPIITSLAENSIKIPDKFELSHNYPNPFNPQTTIKFQLPSKEYVTLKIYNMRGQLVRTLVSEEMNPGYYDVIWEGRDDQGVLVSNGLYVFQFKAGNYQKAKKMIMLK